MKFILPLPLSINRTYGVGKKRDGSATMFKNEKATDWETEAGWMIRAKHPGKPLEGPVQLEIEWFYKVDRDIDAGLKLLLDLLQKQRVYLDDRQVRRINKMTIQPDPKNPRVEVTINEIT